MGTLFSLIGESFPPKSHFNVSDIPDLTGRVVIVTGGNTGIGYETVKALLGHNAKVYVASRSKDKAKVAIEKLKSETKKTAQFLPLDLANFASIRESVKEFKSKEKELHILFNNAGVMVPPMNEMTADGYDLQFGTNVLGHFLFTTELLPLLVAGAATSPDGKARVVNTSSAVHIFHTISWDTLKGTTPARKKLGIARLYSQSKFGNVVFANELARRYADKGIVSTSVSPGNIRSELQRHIPKFVQGVVRPFIYPTPYGALTQLWAGTSPETVDMNGKYFIPWARVGTARAEAHDPALGEALWDWLVKQTASEEVVPPAAV